MATCALGHSRAPGPSEGSYRSGQMGEQAKRKGTPEKWKYIKGGGNVSRGKAGEAPAGSAHWGIRLAHAVGRRGGVAASSKLARAEARAEATAQQPAQPRRCVAVRPDRPLLRYTRGEGNTGWFPLFRCSGKNLCVIFDLTRGQGEEMPIGQRYSVFISIC